MNRLIVLFIFNGIITSAFSQWSIDLKIGAVYNPMSYYLPKFAQDANEVDTRISPNFGIDISRTLGDNYLISMGASFSRRSYTTDTYYISNEIIYDYSFVWNADFVDFKLGLVRYLKRERTYRFGIGLNGILGVPLLKNDISDPNRRNNVDKLLPIVSVTLPTEFRLNASKKGELLFVVEPQLVANIKAIHPGFDDRITFGYGLSLGLRYYLK